jgi:hypothetical protein
MNPFKNDFNDFDKKFNAAWRFIWIIWIIGVVTALSLVGTVIYVALRYASTLH